MPKNTNTKVGLDTDVIDDIIPPADEVEATPRPSNLGGPTYKEEECDKAAEEQPPLHTAQGELESRPFDVTVAQNEAPAEASRKQLKEARQLHRELVAFRNKARKKLRQYADRPSHGERVYWLRLIGLITGDVAGLSGAALAIGETYFNAIGQAVSAAFAAITLGAIGTEVKRLVQARSRAAAAPKLDKSYAPFRHLFIASNKVDVIVKFVTFGAIAGIAVIAIAIFALRESIEGGAAGLCFGLLALAIGAASFVNSYTTTACAVSDYLDQLDRDVAQSHAELEACKRDPYLKAYAGAIAEAKNIRATWKALGEAARLGRLREKFGILSKNARVVGHGYAAPSGAPKLGPLPTNGLPQQNGNHVNGRSTV